LANEVQNSDDFFYIRGEKYIRFATKSTKVMDKPANRPKALKSASEEHFDALFFGWKMAEGLRSGIATKRLKAYADWFLKTYLIPHFEIEKKYVFPILGKNNVRVKKALANHRRLLRLFKNTDEVFRSLNRIEDEIGRYIRFEERVLYEQIQEKASPQQLKKIKEQHDKLKISDEEWEDRFWES